MTSVEQRLLELWSSSAVRVALWADSSYDPLEEKDILKLAQDLDFPLVHFHSSFGGGLTLNNGGCNHAWNPKTKPEDVVIIEMGYNDESTASAKDIPGKMRKQEWYKTLADSVAFVKFVIFIEQLTYKQVCPPKPKKKKKSCSGWVEGTLVEGSKWTNEAMELCQELGIPALCLKGASPQELFGDMMTTDAEGTVWQNKAVCRSYTSNGQDFSEDGKLALWEDSFHSTAEGAKMHFRFVVQALKTRFLQGGFDAFPFKQTASGTQQTSLSQASWTEESQSAMWQQQVSEMMSSFAMWQQPPSFQQAAWHGSGPARSHPYW